MREVIISEREEGQRLDRYLEKYMPDAPKSFFYKMLRKKNIVLNDKKATGNEKHFAQFSGSFMATVEQLLPDYYALPGKTIAVVHFFQDRPFLLHFQKDLTGELIEGTSYVFEFETFEVELPDDEENPDISDYMYSINVTSYRVAEDDELGLEGKMPTVEIVSK